MCVLGESLVEFDEQGNWVFSFEDKAQYHTMVLWCREMMGRSHLDRLDPNWYTRTQRNFELMKRPTCARQVIIRNLHWGRIASLIWG